MKRFLQLLKTQGSLSTSEISRHLKMTTEGARLQLTKMQNDGLVVSVSEVQGVGRPVLKWRLAEKGQNHFPDSHADLSVQLIETIKSELGENALGKIIAAREKETSKKYISETGNLKTIEQKLSRLTELRKQEGYMAEWKKEGKHFLFIENHCPICSAAKICTDLCQSELNSISDIFGSDFIVSRTEHIIDGARRCVYKIE